MLHSAGAGSDRWPLAARYLSETLWKTALGEKKKCPPFLSEVLVRKRHWKSEELLPTQEKVKYLAPSWVHHGHWIEHENGFKTLARMVMTDLQEPAVDRHWVGLQWEPDPVGARWRIQEKASLRELKVEDEEKEEDREDQVRRMAWKVLEEEMTLARTDEPAALDTFLSSLAELRQAIVKEEKEILQTKIVSVSEVKKNIEAWSGPISAEIEALCQKKEAIKEISEEMGKELVQKDLTEVIPPSCSVRSNQMPTREERKER